ncbi:type I restriction-modification system subunit M [Tenacibaculum maritimum]|uniref:type I restriction-modification system subunit M n=1 Tax=Tenacibaculum maritimum TaxID=107401 RepID=UPI0012E4FCDD|nr:type I restriction-modification system subunit M [Tenacibaculum maritimum]MCD9563206.1 type I restriction-modification system subunit M [Tenacibaculum maritimum]MCD9566542.1 type I restriction-modification system subunit M [Tenacibaculum maritimum]MCD9579844.1 type I restriction-modification system subunit M [Tenacibaculum maritimum]MCD9597400.1 type I restriction-modification system subunit M [Tenacibaculum maritimum]MCD9614414.1 type I restriction-modification system subunit M [Tenacibacu
MAIKKSDLYSSLWASCDELRGGMDASQYKDYVLTMLFVKYVSDKYAGNSRSLIEVPKGASFEDMVALKGQPDIGDRINKDILKPLFAANGLEGAMELADFNDDEKLGSGKEKVDRLSKLIAIFEHEGLNFKNNRAEDDDILGDAYEFLMRHFATESGKSKGQFYTPAEVSRILAQVIEVDKADRPSYTAYDPTCGSGSLLLKVADEAPNGLTLYGQEKDIATKGLAIMNMWLHGHPEASIASKNTITDPQFKEDGRLKRFDFVVANPPFSVKNWTSGIVPMNDVFHRFKGYGVPPEKNGDYAFLLHIVSSLKSTGKGAVILPHGVLFRGNAEAEIRKNILERKWIKGIIGLPANLFYGTGIPACVIVLDKEHANKRKGVFMIDASKGFIKDGNKNRLREQDLYKIVEVFNSQMEVDRYARCVPFAEIEKNEYNLNIPRYIDTQEAEDIQDLDGHLNGGIPQRDIAALQEYWEVYPTLKQTLLSPLRAGYLGLNVATSEIKHAIYQHPDFKSYHATLDLTFKEFAAANHAFFNSIDSTTKPKVFIKTIAEDLLIRYANKALINKYDVYQHLLDYWNSTLKDDVYLLIEEGWVANTKRVIEKNKSGKEVDKGWTCDVLPKQLIIDTYLAKEQQALQAVEAELESVQAKSAEWIEEHTGEEGLLQEATNDKGGITKTTLSKYLKEIKDEPTEVAAFKVANQLLKLFNKEASLKKEVKVMATDLDALCLAQYGKLTEEEVRELVVDKKWLASLQATLQTEMDAISQRLTSRIQELAERYEHTLTELDGTTNVLENKVSEHLKTMGLVWS